MHIDYARGGKNVKKRHGKSDAGYFYIRVYTSVTKLLSGEGKNEAICSFLLFPEIHDGAKITRIVGGRVPTRHERIIDRIFFFNVQ